MIRLKKKKKKKAATCISLTLHTDGKDYTFTEKYTGIVANMLLTNNSLIIMPATMKLYQNTEGLAAQRKGNWRDAYPKLGSFINYFKDAKKVFFFIFASPSVNDVTDNNKVVIFDFCSYFICVCGH